MQSIALVLFAAAVELMQVWVPGRHPRLSDFAAGVLGLGLGIGLAYVSTRMARGEKMAGLSSTVSSRRPGGEGIASGCGRPTTVLFYPTRVVHAIKLAEASLPVRKQV